MNGNLSLAEVYHGVEQADAGCPPQVADGDVSLGEDTLVEQRCPFCAIEQWAAWRNPSVAVVDGDVGELCVGQESVL